MGKDIKKIFEEHWKEKQKLPLTTVAEQSGDIEEVIKAYEDRVVFELLQNALDKAKDKILVKVIDNVLYIANDDGKRMTFAQDGESDFESLCSIHNSNKSSAEAIGNKGIGFKSVFSSSSDGSVTIYAKLDDSEEFIAFKYYGKIDQNIVDNEDTYKNNDDIKAQLKNKKKFIPGFYYPILLEKENLLDEFKDYVTVVKIPLKNELVIENLFNEIRERHFYFVATKGDDYTNIKIDFQHTDNFSKQTSNKDKLIIGSLKDKAKLKLSKLSKEAGLSNDIPNVSIYFNEDETTNIYTYLPTKMNSPFLHCDINSDFQTKENRESMDFDKSGKISQYNTALLTACIELHFLSLSKYIDNCINCFNFEYIEDKNNNIVNFDDNNLWKYLQLNDEPLVRKETIKIIKKIFNDDWHNFGNFIAKLAKKYFDKQNNLMIKTFDNFWNIIEDYACISYRVNGNYTTGYAEPKRNLYNYFLNNLDDAKVVPLAINNDKVYESGLLSKKIFFHKSGKSNINIPKVVNVKLITYDFANLSAARLFERKHLYEKTKTKISEFSNSYELLKHFRQIPKDGTVNNNKLDEVLEDAKVKQKKILDSLYQIYNDLKNKNCNYDSTHRYNGFITDQDSRKKANVKNNAYFSISTIFLKIKGDKYKPAQLCRKKDLELEDDFYGEIAGEDDFDGFLQFLGVSLDDKYIFCEGEIYENYQKGLDCIPAVVDESIGELSAREIIPNISIVDLELENPKKQFAWQCYRNNNYEPILKEIKTKNESLKKIVKSIKKYPKEYLKELVTKLESESDIEATKKLYQVILNRQLEIDFKCKNYLIYNNGTVELSILDGVFIPQTKNDFIIIWKHRDKISKKFLMAYTDRFDSEDLELVVVEEKK